MLGISRTLIIPDSASTHHLVWPGTGSDWTEQHTSSLRHLFFFLSFIISQVFTTVPHTPEGAEETTVTGLNLQESLPNPITFQQMTHMCWVALVTQS